LRNGGCRRLKLGALLLTLGYFFLASDSVGKSEADGGGAQRNLELHNVQGLRAVAGQELSELGGSVHVSFPT
jgi:hypothetical protein